MLGRFISPDTVVPGNADGSLDGIALKPLTVAFHEPGFIATLQAENQQPFWFQMSAAQRQRAGNPMGPANPQALNRYSYVLNNPLKWTDPSGHVPLSGGDTEMGYSSVCSDSSGAFANCGDTFVNELMAADGFTLVHIWITDDTGTHSKLVSANSEEFREFRKAVDDREAAKKSAIGNGVLAGAALLVTHGSCAGSLVAPPAITLCAGSFGVFVITAIVAGAAANDMNNHGQRARLMFELAPVEHGPFPVRPRR